MLEVHTLGPRKSAPGNLLQGSKDDTKMDPRSVVVGYGWVLEEGLVSGLNPVARVHVCVWVAQRGLSGKEILSG